MTKYQGSFIVKKLQEIKDVCYQISGAILLAVILW